MSEIVCCGCKSEGPLKWIVLDVNGALIRTHYSVCDDCLLGVRRGFFVQGVTKEKGALC